MEMANVAVIGAGVMGSGIAAELASAGLAVVLLDVDSERAQAGVSRQLRSGGFADPGCAENIRTGSSLSDLSLLADAGWIIESASERIDVKQQIYESLDPVRKPNSIISSNTSTMTTSRLVDGQSEAFARDFLITHFFNPPRWMRLLEIVEGRNTRPGVAAAISDFAARRLGKSVVVARDTPGFIANRIGNFWMAVALDEAVSSSLKVEEADAILSQIFGGPAGIFGLLDLVGIDLLPSGWGSLKDALPADDPLQAYAAEPPLVADMIAKGRVGRKGSGGFFRRLENGEFEALDLVTQEYRPRRVPATAAAGENLRALVEKSSPAGLFAARVTALTLRYVIELAPQIADSNELVDQAMRDGYGWKLGPFELIERIGRDWMEAQEEAVR